MNCPNCNKEFVEQRDKAYRCADCGWLTQVDGKWVTCPEPLKLEAVLNPPEPKPIPEPKPKDPEPEFFPAEPELCVKRYLGGLITVTEVEDEDDD
jgi:hypothetical protein